MKKVLIVPFDLTRPGESPISLSIASLSAYLKNDARYGKEFNMEIFSINMLENKEIQAKDVFEQLTETYQIEKFDFIFLSCYIWSEHITNPLIRLLRKAGYKNVIGLGGYQITYSHTPTLEYPDCQIFITGYGEVSLLKAITEEQKYPVLFRDVPDIACLPSPYLSGEISIKHGQRMVRMETLRGCPYRCNFCAHRDLLTNKVYLFPEERVFEELAFFKYHDVQKINILDPIFNMGQRATKILEKIRDIDFQGLVSLQTRFENIRGEKGRKFLDLCSQISAHLEFGVQSIHASEYNAVNRPNKIEHIAQVMAELNKRGISYEISLIYGLPNQTYDSFCQSIEYVKNHGCIDIKAYPLMLLKGTELYYQKEVYNFREETIGDYQIPVVVSSNSFTESEWQQMHEIANSLVMNERYL